MNRDRNVKKLLTVTLASVSAVGLLMVTATAAKADPHPSTSRLVVRVIEEVTQPRPPAPAVRRPPAPEPPAPQEARHTVAKRPVPSPPERPVPEPAPRR